MNRAIVASLLPLPILLSPLSAQTLRVSAPLRPSAGTPLVSAQPQGLALRAECPSDAAAPGLLPRPAALPTVAADPVKDLSTLTGALTRSHEDPGPVKRMWFVYGSEKERTRAADTLSRVRAANPGVEVVERPAAEVLAGLEDDGTFPPEAARRLSEALSGDGAEFVLGTNHEVYEAFRSLRDSGYARATPFGVAGRRSVTVDIPRASLDPQALSDPRTLPHRRFLVIGRAGSLPVPEGTGMRGTRSTLEDILAERRAAEPRQPWSWDKVKLRLLMRLSGEEDPREVRALRADARRLADYLEDAETDVLVTDDPAVAALAAWMKRDGFHVSLPVVWQGETAPPDASAVSLRVRGRAEPALARAVRDAAALRRLPENFGEVGGTPVLGYEEAVRKALPRPEPGRGEAVFLLSAGSGQRRKGDSNAYGHFALAVTDPEGTHRVWTVHYNDRMGSPFTGGTEDDRLTLGEYLYRLHEIPGAARQPSLLAETSVGPVLAFVLRGLTPAAVEAMREMASFLNATHLAGKDSYDYFNKDGKTNCISLVTKVLRAAGFPIAESGTQAPGDKAVEFIRGFSRMILENRVKASEVDFVVFDRPAHSASTYRIPNVPLGSPFIDFRKPWAKMSLWERFKALAHHPFEFLRVPAYIKAFTAMATRRVTVGPGSRTPAVEELPGSPLARLIRAEKEVSRLEGERAPLMLRRRELEDSILSRLGLGGWQRNPEGDLRALSRSRIEAGLRLSPGQEEALRAELEAHHRLDLALGLNRLDGLLAAREADLLKLETADPLRRNATRLDRLRALHSRALALRARMIEEDRLLGEEEVDELAVLDARVESELHRLRTRILGSMEEPVPQDVRTILRGQVTRDLLEELEASAAPKPAAAPRSGAGYLWASLARAFGR